MRDAFGGAFMIKVFIVFVFIYISFTAIALNYAKAFKVKNMIIDYLQDNEIVNLNDMTASEENAMKEFIENEIYGNMNYHVNVSDMCNNIETTDAAGRKIAYCNNVGIFIKQNTADDNFTHHAYNTEGVYYTVSTYASWNISFLNKLLALGGNNQQPGDIQGAWRISGQTRVIVNQ